MNGSASALFSGIVDYAGLFPPAKLAMDTVVGHYARYRGGPRAWMLGRLIIPTGRFDEFADALAAARPKIDEPWHLSALGTGGDDADDFPDSVRRDVAAINRLGARTGGAIIVDAYEKRLPVSMVGGAGRSPLADRVMAAMDALLTGGVVPISAVFEIGFAENWPERVPVVVAALADAGMRVRERFCADANVAAKIRTGGVRAAMFPSCEQVAGFIGACRTSHVAFKATAGLHHPFRHFDEVLQTHMHGFVNVLAAAGLAWRDGLDDTVLADILADQTVSHFALDDNGLVWRGRRVPVEGFGAMRASAMLGFGSCSFGEPVEDLIAAGWL